EERDRRGRGAGKKFHPGQTKAAFGGVSILKDREEVMESTLEDWKTCFTQLGPALLLFARRWTNSRGDAEHIVQDAFVRSWRRQHSIENRALLYATVRSTALDRLRSDQR